MKPKTGERSANWCLTDVNISAANEEHAWAGPSAGVLISSEVERPSRNRICSRSCHLEAGNKSQYATVFTCHMFFYYILICPQRLLQTSISYV